MKENLQKCFDSDSGRKDTAGNPIKMRVCYCGTTACTKLGDSYYPLPKDFKQIQGFSDGELSKEEEEKFYKRVLKSNNL